MKQKTIYVCRQCGEESIAWQGRCPVCEQWNSFQALTVAGPVKTGGRVTAATLETLSLATTPAAERQVTGIEEFDRAVGGGLVAGSVVLIGGEPGVGKSTLLLQLVDRLGAVASYFSGEESLAQVADRARRLALTPAFSFANETDVNRIVAAVENASPKLIVIDSIQTMYDDAYPSTPGSLVQVREAALKLQLLAKRRGVIVMLVGHITKEGTVAGPKTLEHMVDVVVYLEGDPRHNIRLLRSVKNRFGATHEVGLFALTERGLEGVTDPTMLFTENHSPTIAGSALTVAIEGLRPILIEVQALVVPTAFGYPKRTALGIDLQRLSILLAIIEARTAVRLDHADVFVNVVGGYRLTDRSADLAVCLAVLSAHRAVALPAKTVFVGEVGLTGEVRPPSQGERRAAEAKRLGFVLGRTGGQLAEIAAGLGLRKKP